MRYFWSDTHFNHANILNYTERPWSSLDDMNWILIENYNSVVASEDECFFIGDMCMGQIEQTLPLLGELFGRKHLILGNHDRPFPTGKNLDRWFSKYNRYFESIKLHDVITIDDRPVVLNHFPYLASKRDADRKIKYEQFYPVDDGEWLIHGHIHSSEWLSSERALHVGVDADWSDFGVERYHPIPESAIVSAMNIVP